MPSKKPRVAIVSLTSCEGCQFALFDLGEKFLNFLKRVKIEEFRLIEDEIGIEEEIKKNKSVPKDKIQYDFSFVEGSPITEEDLKILKELRIRSKKLIVLGNCAALGGIPEIKNYQNKEKTIRYVYKNLEGIANPEIKEIDNFVKVDLTIPGCPIDGEEFLRIANDLLVGKLVKIPQRPVCYECQLKEYECLLQKKELCLGPIILGGCQAICLKSKMSCFGCRGILAGAKSEKLLNLIKKQRSKEDLEETLEIFGIKDELEDVLGRDRE